MILDLLRFLLFAVAGWVQREQQAAINCLLAENAVLRAHVPRKCIRFTDGQCRELARAVSVLCARTRREVATLVTPETLLRWYGQIVARKYTTPGSDPVFTTQVIETLARPHVAVAVEPRVEFARQVGVAATFPFPTHARLHFESHVAPPLVHDRFDSAPPQHRLLSCDVDRLHVRFAAMSKKARLERRLGRLQGRLERLEALEASDATAQPAASDTT